MFDKYLSWPKLVAICLVILIAVFLVSNNERLPKNYVTPSQLDSKLDRLSQQIESKIDKVKKDLQERRSSSIVEKEMPIVGSIAPSEKELKAVTEKLVLRTSVESQKERIKRSLIKPVVMYDYLVFDLRYETKDGRFVIQTDQAGKPIFDKLGRLLMPRLKQRRPLVYRIRRFVVGSGFVTYAGPNPYYRSSTDQGTNYPFITNAITAAHLVKPITEEFMNIKYEFLQTKRGEQAMWYPDKIMILYNYKIWDWAPTGFQAMEITDFWGKFPEPKSDARARLNQALQMLRKERNMLFKPSFSYDPLMRYESNIPPTIFSQGLPEEMKTRSGGGGNFFIKKLYETDAINPMLDVAVLNYAGGIYVPGKVLRVSTRAGDLTWGSSRPDIFSIGSKVYVAGFPLGSHFSLRPGEVTANPVNLSRPPWVNLIEISADTVQGNSGGPVFSADQGYAFTCMVLGGRAFAAQVLQPVELDPDYFDPATGRPKHLIQDPVTLLPGYPRFTDLEWNLIKFPVPGSNYCRGSSDIKASLENRGFGYFFNSANLSPQPVGASQ